MINNDAVAKIRRERPELRFTLQQAVILESLFTCPDRTPDFKTLQAHTAVAPATLSVNLRRMKDKGLIATARDQNDGRFMRVWLTTAGKQFAKAVSK